MMNRELFVQKLRSMQNNIQVQLSESIEDGEANFEDEQVKIQHYVFNKYSRCKNDMQKLQSKFAIEHDA